MHWTGILSLVICGIIIYATIGRLTGNYRWLPDSFVKLSGFFANYKD